MGRATVAVVATLVLFGAGCGGGSDDAVTTVRCDDAAFRAQDEELYVAHATVSNAIDGDGGGDPATLLLDLRRARTALSGYLEAHPPCDEALVDIAVTEQEAIAALEGAITALSEKDDAQSQLSRAVAGLTAAQSALAGGS